MCRILYVRSEDEFSISEQLKKFAEISRESKEYQGHGWGSSYQVNGEWQHYHNISPIWEDDLEQFAETKVLIAHARSAFQDKDIVVENNMPFYDENYIFVFNGELQGVRIKEEGRIGAEKIFNFIKRFDKGDAVAMLKKGVDLIKGKTNYIRAMNIIIAEKDCAIVSSDYSEDPEYFTLNYKQEEHRITICSDPFIGENDWHKIENNSVRVF
ncbi:MAG: hypothetical protein KKA84_06460 [Bacteroidetes bacterium]|nr:hypothetical protein [Bacteroidota bacterium]